MIKFSIIGLVIVLFVYFPYILYILFNKRKYKNHVRNKQIKIIETISKYGILFFSFIDIEGFGYNFRNQVIDIIWVILFFIILLFNYGCYLRYFLNKRNEEYIYKKLIIPYPIQVSECLIFILSGCLLFNPFVIFFGIIYLICKIYLLNKR